MEGLFYFLTKVKNIFYFCVLYSLKDNKLYKGYTSYLSQRFLKHNAGGTTSTKNRRPIVLIYAEKFESKKEALDREKWSKTLEGGVAINKLLIQKNILTLESTLVGNSAS